MDLSFIRGQFTEAQLEEAIISLFQEQDYKYVHGETIHRGFDEILLKDDLHAYLANHYPDLTAAETKKVISRLENIPSAPLYIGKALKIYWTQPVERKVLERIEPKDNKKDVSLLRMEIK